MMSSSSSSLAARTLAAGTSVASQAKPSAALRNIRRRGRGNVVTLVYPHVEIEVRDAALCDPQRGVRRGEARMPGHQLVVAGREAVQLEAAVLGHHREGTRRDEHDRLGARDVQQVERLLPRLGNRNLQLLA